jgi:hypothetical protein
MEEDLGHVSPNNRFANRRMKLHIVMYMCLAFCRFIGVSHERTHHLWALGLGPLSSHNTGTVRLKTG